MPASHLFRDPDTLTNREISEQSLVQEEWTTGQRLAMHDAFVAAMQSAGYSVTSASTTFGTRSPVQGYTRLE